MPSFDRRREIVERAHKTDKSIRKSVQYALAAERFNESKMEIAFNIRYGSSSSSGGEARNMEQLKIPCAIAAQRSISRARSQPPQRRKMKRQKDKGI